MVDLRKEAARGLELGHVFTPLRGKVPVLTGWTTAEPPSWADICAWLEAGHNLGVRTGRISGFNGLDLDVESGKTPADFPATWTVLTGSGAWHLYYALAPFPIGNKAGTVFGPNIDIRGDGGQLVYPGSIHPDTGEPYQWVEGLGPDDLPMAPFPLDMLSDEQRAKLEGKPAKPAPKPAGPIHQGPRAGFGNARARAALSREVKAVATAGEGTRNARLNEAAHSLGTLVGNGELNRGEVEEALTDAAVTAGLDGFEIGATIRSGLGAGVAKPRTDAPRIGPPPAPPRPAAVADDGTPPPPPPIMEDEPVVSSARDASSYVLVPAPQYDDQGVYCEQTSQDVCDEIIPLLPDGLIYRQSFIPGTVEGPAGDKTFKILSPERVRKVVDTHARLGRWVQVKSGDAKGSNVMTFQPCSADIAKLVLEEIERSEHVSTLSGVVNYPMYLPDWSLAQAGWNRGDLYYDQPAELAKLEPETDAETIRCTLEDLVIDFPFCTPADMQNFFGLMLTPLIRMAADSNVPLHMTVAPLRGTGKSLLIQEVFGRTITGQPQSGGNMAGDDNEKNKAILSQLLAGRTIWCLDNLNDFLDSASLASVLTSRAYSGRILGESRTISLPNNMTIVATGNNVQLTGELARRCVPITLQPLDDRPEDRTQFRHADLPKHLRENRLRIWNCLVGAVELWKAAGRPKGAKPMGSFEGWSRVAGGIMGVLGFDEWRANEQAWRHDADPHREDMAKLVEHWWATYRNVPVSAATLAGMAEGLDLFADVFTRPTEKGRQTAFGQRVLLKARNQPVGRFIIRRRGSASSSAYLLEESQTIARSNQ